MRKILLLLSLAAIAACTTTTEQGETRTDRAATGAAVGGVTGAVIGKQIDDGRGAVIGGIVGGAIGAAVGQRMDEQERTYLAALEEERQANEVEIERLREDLLRLTLSNEVTFPVDSAAIRPEFRDSLGKVAKIMRQYPQTQITIVGHTDETGPEAYNQILSEQRAESVASYLAAQGVAAERLATEGLGEMRPRASNETPQGRQLNRRVEIYLQSEETAAPS